MGKQGPTDKQCPWCMGLIDPAASVCPHCQAVKHKDGWRSAEQVAKNGRTGLLLSVVAIVIVVGLGAVIWNANKAANKAEVDEKMEQVNECIRLAGTGARMPDYC